ncbi:sulfite exporter TauE/SafE family protein [Nocardioides sp. zg-536]|uniref:Probable membrane transporter protein n=1 Tax=Nocardioides faecalis TaxID=2803858 RepID=A0A938XYU9_9ACTN|nr:sulfite exporter TauE/SafE family protein [Nocardioides faecalis]MBM9459002.1 sulfite exporter TauE/SafE family protein [Nocardioides faecalis]QVI57270.1 sulfite exporter TauE/SafE family protein [Nocardioides faecalis]
MGTFEIVAILLAGVGAGTINAVVGSGTLITFPTLLALGVPPVTANMSNSLGLVPGSVAGAVGYRRELAGQRTRVLRLLIFSTAGGVLGALLLLWLPPDAFEAVVPALILLGVVLVIVQPRLSRAVAARTAAREQARELADPAGHPAGEQAAVRQPVTGAWWVPIAAFGTGVYGGYFGAAQGVILMAVLGIGISESLQRLNGVKNVLVAVVNGVAGLIFVVVAELGLLGTDAEVDWLLVLVIGVGAVIGGFLGASVGRRLPAVALRSVIVVVGLAAVVSILLG